MERNLVTVQGSIEFRDVVMTRDRENHGQPIYVRLHGYDSVLVFQAPVYRVIPRHVDQFEKIVLSDLFGQQYPPVYMEDFAQALVAAGAEAPKVDIFALGGA